MTNSGNSDLSNYPAYICIYIQYQARTRLDELDNIKTAWALVLRRYVYAAHSGRFLDRYLARVYIDFFLTKEEQEPLPSLDTTSDNSL